MYKFCTYQLLEANTPENFVAQNGHKNIQSLQLHKSVSEQHPRCRCRTLYILSRTQKAPSQFLPDSNFVDFTALGSIKKGDIREASR